jgi:hypothetical protein
MSHEQWQSYRNEIKTLGGSEIGAALGLSKYTSNIELYYKKLGLFQVSFGYRISMAMGNMMEPTLQNVMQYHDLDEAVFAENMDKNRKQHKVKNEKHTLYPLEWPMLHAHLDGLIRYKGLKGTGVLELKWQSSFTIDMYESGISPEYLAQVLIYAHALGLDFGVLGIFTGNHQINVHMIERSEELVGKWRPILEDFWVRLLKARTDIKRAREIDPNIDDASLYAIASVHEPQPFEENAQPWMSFMTERAKTLELENQITATDEMHDYLDGYREAMLGTKGLKKDIDEAKAMFMKALIDADAGKITFADGSSVTFRWNERYQKNILKVNLKK